MKTSVDVHLSAREINIKMSKIKVGVIMCAGWAAQIFLFLMMLWVNAAFFGLAKTSVYTLTFLDYTKILIPTMVVNLIFYLMVYKPTLLKEQKRLKMLTQV